jgi:hypothetical protein
MKKKRLWNTVAALPPAAMLLFAVCAAQTLHPLPAITPIPDPSPGDLVSRPLAEAADALQARYAMVVTYEDPTLLNREDMELHGSDESLRGAFLPRRGRFALPDELTPQRRPNLTADALAVLLGSFHAANPDGPHFRLLQTQYGFHIVPDTIRDQGGSRVKGTSILDAVVSVPHGLRTAGGHINAVCDAVAKATGVRILRSDAYTDQFYAFNGLVPDMNTLLSGTQQALQAYSFPWGASGVPARDALVSLLQGSATTLTWRMMCGPSTMPQNRECALNLHPMTVIVAGPDGQPAKRLLQYDRCARCPPLSQPRVVLQRPQD